MLYLMLLASKQLYSVESVHDLRKIIYKA